jgi:hypothetical protein
VARQVTVDCNSSGPFMTLVNITRVEMTNISISGCVARHNGAAIGLYQNAEVGMTDVVKPVWTRDSCVRHRVTRVGRLVCLFLSLSELGW